MRIDLTCPFEDRHQAKAAGAQWDVARRVWYLTDPVSLAPFTKWLPPEIGAFLKPKPRKKRH